MKVPKQLGCLEERHDLPQWCPGRSPGRELISVLSGVKECFSLRCLSLIEVLSEDNY